MTLYKCECCKETKEVGKATIVHREGKWVCKEAICSCGKYMDSEPVDGMPTLRRTEQSLSKNKDRLWKDTKEKLLDGNDS
tara:strand:+ start:498 stop:737 length:240 start_codon:yes stop_codon:yes gene_type:complete